MIMVAQIQRAVAADYGLPVETMWEPRGYGSQLKERVRPRQLAMYLAMTLTDKGPTRAGRLFHRDHSTVIHGARAARRRVIADRETQEAARRIARLVLAGDVM